MSARIDILRRIGFSHGCTLARNAGPNPEAVSASGQMSAGAVHVPGAWKLWLLLIFALFWMGNAAVAVAGGEPEERLEEKGKASGEEAPATAGPLITDTAVPIELHKASVQFLWSVGVAGGNFDRDWQRVNAGGDFVSLSMPVKFTYGLAKDFEIYAVIPYVHNFASHAEEAGPHGETASNYGGLGDVSVVGKYLLFDETPVRPAISGIFGVGFPTGKASDLEATRLGTDAIGGGAFVFSTGVNLYKYLQPFLLYSNVWFNTPVNVYSGEDTTQSRNYVNFNLAAEYPFTSKWIALMEFYSTWTWDKDDRSPSTVLGVLPGIELVATENWAFSLGTAIDLAGKDTVMKYTPMFTVYYNF